ncbi:DNA polymerase Y family protein [Aedoeadaptatus urinae]|uniref:DNA polymerase Y family protein n=1 Tax=Aedoeadaptatus urinae TaxID=1871017 RepID=UPI00097D4429|nr:DNA polymerase IV [Peptoniphilus urinae]
MKRVILHSDMNNCYASIEIQRNPSLRGKALVVGGSVEDRHGIVLAKSMEAKAMGIQTGEALWQARNKCPNLIVVEPHYEVYLDFSRRARAIYYDYTNQVEPFGLDECWLDVTGSTHLFGSGEAMAHAIRRRMKEELGITVSIGVSFTKTFAKLGSDMKKPDAVTVIAEEDVARKVYPLPADAMIGIGRKTREKLRAVGIDTLGDLAAADVALLKSRLGINGVKLWKKARGMEEDPVRDRDDLLPVKSVGNGITLREDLKNPVEVRRIFQILAIKVAKRLREGELMARGIEIHLRDKDLRGASFQCKLPYDGASSFLLRDSAFDLYLKKMDPARPLRAVTLRATDLVPQKAAVQLDLFSDYEKKKREDALDEAIYKIRRRYGEGALTFLGLLNDTKMPLHTTDVVTLPHPVLR